MELNILFVIALAAIIVATLQDLKRREVDNWLNYSLLFFGVILSVYHSLFISDLLYLRNALLLVGIGFVLHYAFYFGRVFAGGDAKLLFGLSPFFVQASLLDSVFSYFVFIFLMFLCGGIYGMVYSFVLYLKHFKKSNVKIHAYLKSVKFGWFLCAGIICFILGYTYEYLFTLLGILLISFPLLLSFAKGVEDIVMIRTIHGKNLREGDWLVSDVKVGKRQVKATFEGVSKEDMHLLRNTKKVQIKDGLPFVPAFLFGFILYHLYADVLIEQVIRIVVGG